MILGLKAIDYWFILVIFLEIFTQKVINWELVNKPILNWRKSMDNVRWWHEVGAGVICVWTENLCYVQCWGWFHWFSCSNCHIFGLITEYTVAKIVFSGIMLMKLWVIKQWRNRFILVWQIKRVGCLLLQYYVENGFKLYQLFGDKGKVKCTKKRGEFLWLKNVKGLHWY